VRRGADGRSVRFPGRDAIVAGADLERLLERLIAFRVQMQAATRRGVTRRVLMALLDQDAHDRSFFANLPSMDALAEALGGESRTVSVILDEEHSLYRLEIEERNGHARSMTVAADVVLSGEFRALSATYRDLRGLAWPATVVSDAAAADAEDEHEPEGEPAEPERPRPAKARAADIAIASPDELVEHFIAAGKRGVAINRYKGLGEMNPDQLWATTMDPAARTLLQVKAEDHTEADQMFTTLMGDQVEPRRKFIEDNALDVKNLDI